MKDRPRTIEEENEATFWERWKRDKHKHHRIVTLPGGGLAVSGDMGAEEVRDLGTIEIDMSKPLFDPIDTKWIKDMMAKANASCKKRANREVDWGAVADSGSIVDALRYYQWTRGKVYPDVPVEPGEIKDGQLVCDKDGNVLGRAKAGDA